MPSKLWSRSFSIALYPLASALVACDPAALLTQEPTADTPAIPEYRAPPPICTPPGETRYELLDAYEQN